MCLLDSGIDEKYGSPCICVSVCPFVPLYILKTKCQNIVLIFCTCYLWPWLVSYLMTVLYTMYFHVACGVWNICLDAVLQQIQGGPKNEPHLYHYYCVNNTKSMQENSDFTGILMFSWTLVSSKFVYTVLMLKILWCTSRNRDDS